MSAKAPTTTTVIDIGKESKVRKVDLRSPFERDPRKMFPTMHKAIELAEQLDVPCMAQRLRRLQKVIEDEDGDGSNKRDERWDASDSEEDGPPSKRSHLSPSPIQWGSDDEDNRQVLTLLKKVTTNLVTAACNQQRDMDSYSVLVNKS